MRITFLGAITTTVAVLALCGDSKSSLAQTAATQPAATQPLPPLEAAASLQLPDGFSATLFAGEPDIVQPIALTFDDRGRLWLVECLSYPSFSSDGPGRDRVTVLTDADHDGQFDSKQVFFSEGQNLSGIEWGYGGVWLCSSPNLLFIPDRDQDLVPDGPAEVVLNGWDVTAKHNVFNGLIWGPDSWLYGCNGILSNSKVGPPEAGEQDRVAINCGIWRYHPLKKTFEAVAHGTTNPWGLDYDSRGEFYLTNCVIKHAFHVVPGAHFERMFGQDINPFSFKLIPSCADHLHWAGGFWDTEGVDKPENDNFGGGHAHCGAMVYLGDNWPAQYRDGLFTLNVHGRRLNHDTLHPAGSGMIAEHAPDPVKSNDPFFRGVAVKYGPDGGVYITDWSDTGECHDYEESGIERENGRIFKIVYQAPHAQRIADLATSTPQELFALQHHPNEWWVRHARRLLAERAAAGQLSKSDRAALIAARPAEDDPAQLLHWLWALHAIGESTTFALVDKSPALRAWAVRFAFDEPTLSEAVKQQLLSMADKDPSPVVRRELASGLIKMPQALVLPIAKKLLSVQADQDDPLLPYLVWYGVEPWIAAHPKETTALLGDCHWPMVLENAARRLALLDEFTPAIELVAAADHAEQRAATLQGFAAAVAGRKGLSLPAASLAMLEKQTQDPAAQVQELAWQLLVQFGADGAAEKLTAMVQDGRQNTAFRERALATLVQQQVTGLDGLLVSLLKDESLRGPAIRGLAATTSQDTPARLLAIYARLPANEQADVITTLVSRKSYAVELVTAMEQGTVSRADVSPFVARQLVALGDEALTARLVAVWGALKPASEEKTRLKAEFKAYLTAQHLAAADTARGRAIFARQCGTCHRMFDAGAKVGPELTGAQRGNLDYVLDNVLDPSAVVPRDYQVTNFQTVSGRLISGIIREETPNAVTVQTPNDLVVVPVEEIDIREPGNVSMMPEGLFSNLTADEIRDLVAYLASEKQAALPSP